MLMLRKHFTDLGATLRLSRPVVAEGQQEVQSGRDLHYTTNAPARGELGST